MPQNMTQKKICIYPVLFLLKVYRLLISPWINACRFRPTCSEYAIESFIKFGLFKGSLLTLKRLLRCHPWGGCGFDPVPEENNSKNFKVASSKRNVYKSEKSKDIL